MKNINYDFDNKNPEKPPGITNHRVVRCCGNCRHFFRFHGRNGYCLYPKLRKNVKRKDTSKVDLDLYYKKTHEHLICDQYAILRSKNFLNIIKSWINKVILKNGYISDD